MDNNVVDTQFCLHYHGEDECPFRDEYKARVWMAELHACKSDLGTPREFLSFVCAYISKWDPYTFQAFLARYISKYPEVSVNEKAMVARTYEVTYDESLVYEKPRGRTIYESRNDGGYFGSNSGVLLYTDGRLYEVTSSSPEPRISFGFPAYRLLGTCREMGQKVKAYLLVHRTEVMALPAQAECWDILDGATYEIKFLSKTCKGYMLPESEDGAAVVEMASRVVRLVRSFGYLREEQYGWAEE
ncbi:hypothetical protein SAMN05720764_101391 [Fibrobacter sp. UWH5]|uniref:hypothetical protein n=1 Tax=Fibrobacter sp. UWH5 TaxID=1896211 RepID=UPI00090ECDC8|nr:hypothetical protein [Fibrobacter sp. UWH5]SHK42347.1 hypothetical protein SAMN05720764_101391 [Fibrobacter sp. UWH5]